MKQNCWEFKKCGREPGGDNIEEFGVCPTPCAENVNGIHEGKNGGRVCWAVAGTFCDGKIQGTFAAKISNCQECEFYKKVSDEEKESLMTVGEILPKLS